MSKGSNKTMRYKRTPAAQAKRARQPERTRVNKIKKMVKHLRRHPDDLQAKIPA